MLISSPAETGMAANPALRSGNSRMVVRMVQEVDRSAPQSAPDALPPEPPSNSAPPQPPSLPMAIVPGQREGKTARFDTDIRFYTIEEVDRPALPRLDWELPLDSLAAAGLRRLVIQLWILDSGKIIGADIISATPPVLKEPDRRNIEQRLMQTDVAPAVKGVQRVASQRTLEIVFERQP